MSQYSFCNYSGQKLQKFSKKLLIENVFKNVRLKKQSNPVRVSSPTAFFPYPGD